MGIAPYKTFTFDGESSGDYGVYITGTGVFNAPERSVEMVEIAGRNGSFALDKGKFENIEVTYRVGIVDDSESDFADRVSDFRNWLCSKVGYCRLEDEYNPNEYRMGVYSSGVEIDHDLLIAGEAEITFDCKPQRWLTSGETAVSVADGGTLDNPTLFESEPLLVVEGYGNIAFNNYNVEIENATIGSVILFNGYTSSQFTVSGYGTLHQYETQNLDVSALEIGDSITVNNYTCIFEYTYPQTMTSASVTTSTNVKSISAVLASSKVVRVAMTLNDIVLSYGTPGTSQTAYAKVTCPLQGGGSVATEYNFYVDYDGDSTLTLWATSHGAKAQVKVPDIIGISSRTAILPEIFIDLEVGEAYGYDSGDIVSLNNAVSLGSDLPKLGSGTNTINYDNTITSLKVAPRWWKV